MGQKWAQKIQLGRESTAGTAVAATTIWRGVGGMLEDAREVSMVDEQIGIAIPTTRAYVGQLGGVLSMAATPATFEQILHILEAGIKTVGTGASDGAGSGKIYAYPTPTTAVNTIKTYTIETGDNQQAEEMEYSFVEKFTLTGERGRAVMMSADWIGRQVANTTFTGSLTAPTVEEILTGKGAFYIDAVGGTIGTTAITGTLLQWELTVTTGWRGKWTVDAGQLYFNFIYFDRDSFEAELSMTFEHDATAVAQKALFQAATPRLFRINIPGSTFAQAGTTYSTKTFRIDAAATYTEWGVLDSEDGNSIVNVTAQIGYDPTAAKGLEITVVNDLTSVP
jgi:hypothetical protein